jgi:hypothetical protein
MARLRRSQCAYFDLHALDVPCQRWIREVIRPLEENASLRGRLGGHALMFVAGSVF